MPLLASSMLVACGSTPTSSEEPVLTSSEPTSSETIISSSSSKEEDPYKDLVTVHSGAIGGSLVEIVAREHLFVNSEFVCTFSPSDCEDKHMRAEYDEDLFTLTFDPNVPTKFTLATKGVKGSCILRLYSLDPGLDCLVFRDVIYVDPVIPKTEIAQYLFSGVDSWATNPETALMGQYKMDFISNDPLQIVVSGKDEDLETLKATLELSYKSMRRNYEFLFYVFEIKVIKDDSKYQRHYDEALVTVTGNSIYLYDEDGLLNIFYQSK